MNLIPCTPSADAAPTRELRDAMRALAAAQERFAAECRKMGFEAFAREAETIAAAYTQRVQALANLEVY